MKYLLATGMALCLLISVSTSAQDWSKEIYQVGKMYSGHVIDAKGNKIEGHIKAGNRVDNQKKVLFYSDPKNKKTKVVYKSGDIKGYMVADKTYEAIHYSGGLTSKPIKCLLVVKSGAITEYIWYQYVENYLTMQRKPGESDKDFWARYYDTHTVFKNGDGKPVGSDKLAMGFAKRMSAFVEDYPELAKKVANKEKGYRMLKMYDIIDEYNRWAGDNKK